MINYFLQLAGQVCDHDFVLGLQSISFVFCSQTGGTSLEIQQPKVCGFTELFGLAVLAPPPTLVVTKYVIA